MPVNKQTEQNYKPHSKQKIPPTKIRQNLPFSLPELSLQHVRETESEQWAMLDSLKDKRTYNDVLGCWGEVREEHT